MNEIIIKNDLSSMIYDVRDTKVVLDSDIALILGMETKVLNQKIKRNIKYFNDKNYFRLTKEEYTSLKSQNDNQRSQNDALRSQFATSKDSQRSQSVTLRKYLPYVFTRDGIIILTSILRVKNIYLDELIDNMIGKNITINDNAEIVDMIYNIREKDVMLDSDLAILYGVETKRINEAIKNNPEKFPDRFCFKITKIELESIILRSKISTSKIGQGGRRYLPYVFTEHGVLMLATILKSEVAIKMSVKIIDTFVELKKYVSHISVDNNITDMVIEDHKRIDNLEVAIDKLNNKEVITDVYFNGQVYDAYSKILSIFKKAKRKLIIIDSYADNELLNIIKDVNINVIVITTNKYMTNTLVTNYNMQYNNLKVIYDNSFHDRYFIVDNSIYHCGTSINRIGYKTFSITKISDKITKDAISNKVKSLI